MTKVVIIIIAITIIIAIIIFGLGNTFSPQKKGI